MFVFEKNTIDFCTLKVDFALVLVEDLGIWKVFQSPISLKNLPKLSMNTVKKLSIKTVNTNARLNECLTHESRTCA